MSNNLGSKIKNGNPWRNTLSVLLIGAILYASAASLNFDMCSSAFAQGPSTDTLATILDRKYARVGFSNLTPWGFVAESGELTGVEPTLAKAFLKAQGITEIDGVLTQYVSLIPGLLAGRFDFIGAGMQIRPGRCKEIAFGDPEWMTTQAFITKAGNPLGLTSLDHVRNNTKAKIGVVSGGAEMGYVLDNGVPQSQIVIFPDLITATSGLKAGRIDVMMQTSITMRGLLLRDNDPTIQYVEMTKPALDKTGKPVIGYGAVGFRKGDTALISAWNKWLKNVKQSGEIVKLLSPFGFTAADIAPESVTVEDLCRE